MVERESPIRAAVLGVTGYVGAELVRLLALHPCVRIVHVGARSEAGTPLHTVWPHLHGAVDLTIAPLDAAAACEAADVVFFALPHKHTQGVIAPLFAQGAPSARLIDLSGDFRLDDAADYASAYGTTHTAPELLSRFAYGLPEWNAARIVESDAVASPGCFATAIELALAPLAAARLLPARVPVIAATGSTGSGRSPSATTHHPGRATNYKLYKILAHQHVSEITMALGALGQSTRLSFVPASAPMTHGIFATVPLVFDDVDTARRAASAMFEAYADKPFVHVVEGTAQLNHVVGSNRAEIGITRRGDELVIACAIDNTIKGAGGQAVQSMNLMFGLPETTGLDRLIPACR